jgi:wyosine [tRNA(Phe)-imidazoG37] synthetase (radical SAM superfamily)
LGVDLIPSKTCTFDCLYCEVGRTTDRTIKRRPYVPVDEALEQLMQKLLICSPDMITLAGSGEPTLHSEIDQIIDGIKAFTDTKVAVLTNGSLFWDEEVRRCVQRADIIMPTLSSAFDQTFTRIHKPHPELDLGTIVEGLKSLRSEYQGQLFLEVVFLAGINDTEEEEEALKDVIDTIYPDRIQINTVVRPPSDSMAKPLDRERLDDVMLFFGKNAEVIAGTPVSKEMLSGQTSSGILLDTLRRRPLRAVDMVNSLDLDPDEVDELIKGLLIKGSIRRQEHSGEIFYMSSENGRIEGLGD